MSFVLDIGEHLPQVTQFSYRSHDFLKDAAPI